MYDRFGSAAISGWTHGDFKAHLGNVFYDEHEQKLTFIDYEDMQIKNDSQSEIKNFFKWISGNVNDALGKGRFPESIKNHMNSHQADKLIQSIVDGYLSAFTNEELKIVVSRSIWEGVINDFGNDDRYISKLKKATIEWKKLAINPKEIKAEIDRKKKRISNVDKWVADPATGAEYTPESRKNATEALTEEVEALQKKIDLVRQ